MKRTLLAAPILATAVFLAGCEGDDGKNGLDGASGTDGLNSLVATRALPLGDASCPGGGLVFESGLDTNRNNVLDPAEVTSTEFLDCATAPRLRALHASPDAPAVNVLVNGAVALTNVDYTDGSGFVPVTERTRVQVEAIIPSGNAIVIDETLDLDFSTDYTVIAVGDVAAPIAPLVIANPTGEPIAPGSFRAQVVHAAPDAPAVDVFVTAPGADLATSTPINAAPLAYQQSTDRIQAPAGDYQVRVTLGGNPATVVFDSGAIALPADADLLVAAVENTGPGATPIQLVVLDGTAAADLLDASTPASVVAVHASPDAPRRRHAGRRQVDRDGRSDRAGEQRRVHAVLLDCGRAGAGRVRAVGHRGRRTRRSWRCSSTSTSRRPTKRWRSSPASSAARRRSSRCRWRSAGAASSPSPSCA